MKNTNNRGVKPTGLCRRAKSFFPEITKFSAVGGAGVLVNISVFNLVRHAINLHVVRAGIIATAVAIAINYLGFRYFTYRDRDKTGRARELSLFLTFSGAGLVIENGVLYVATYAFGWDSPLQSNIFKFAGIGVATLFRFWSYRTWVFKVTALPTPDVLHQAPPVLTDHEPGADSASGGQT
ncbi:GtrA family protein [Streptomyces rishiriensis]|uniref:GtrA family protein n=1 Tax=Streptomyces rishiriensis TaxID=68264 RepID=UPI00340EC12B